MKIIVLVPKVVQNYLERFQDSHNQGYPYFNYDRRIVEKSVPRGDCNQRYKGPTDLNNDDFEMIVNTAVSMLNPVLLDYNCRMACEDALTMAIGSLGQYSGKINALRYEVLLAEVIKRMGVEYPQFKLALLKFSVAAFFSPSEGKIVLENVDAKTFDAYAKKKGFNKKKKDTSLLGYYWADIDGNVLVSYPSNKKEGEIVASKKNKMKGVNNKRITPTLLRGLGLSYLEIPLRTTIRKGPQVYRTKGKVFIEKPKEAGMSLKNAKNYTERLDRIAESVTESNPKLALYLDMVSDVLEGRRQASSIKFDADEFRFMADRFNNKVRQRDADETFMDTYNDNDFEQVKREKMNPKEIRVARVPYQRIN